jgi:hypothetical protein
MAAKKRRTSGLRGLSGSPSEHLEHATYRLKRLTRGRVDRMTCGELPEALFSAGTIMAHASESGNRKLLAMAAARTEQIRAKAARCFKR